MAVELRAKGMEGPVFLKGIVQDARVSDEVISFTFSGLLSFSFFTAVPGDPARKQVDLKFDVRKLQIEIPKFGEERDGTLDDPFLVSFENAGRHASMASRTGELVNVVLFRPTLSYDISGVIERVACTHAQVIPERIERQLRGHSVQ